MNFSSEGELGIKRSCLRVKVLLGQNTLRELQVGASQCFGLPGLKATIPVVETFSACALASCGQIFVVLELPVCPADQLLVGNITDLGDLLRTRSFSETSTELRDVVGDTEALSILGTRIDTLVMPSEALRGIGGIRLSRGTRCRISTQLATVCMVVQDVMAGADLTTWG